jgi:tetratricopeptide (TPR) repeat protein
MVQPVKRPKTKGKAAILVLALSSVCIGTCLNSAASPLTYSDPFYTRGVEFYNAKDYFKAARCFELAMQRNPANADAHFYDALTYQQVGQIERAKALYRLTMAVFPRTLAARRSYENLQILKKQTGEKPAPAVEPPKAPTAADKTEVTAARVDEMITKGNALFENGRQHEAERCFFEAIRQGDILGQNSMKLADALRAMGDYYMEIGDSAKACDLYRRELRIREVCLGKNNFQVATCMTHQIGAYTKEGQLDTAEDLLRRCIDIYQKDYDDAEHNHRRLTVQRSNLTGALGSLAGILRQENRSNEAKVFEAQIKELVPQ